MLLMRMMMVPRPRLAINRATDATERQTRRVIAFLEPRHEVVLALRLDHRQQVASRVRILEPRARGLLRAL